MEIKTNLVCPLGGKCEEVRDGEIARCAWYTKMIGQHPQTGAQVDEQGCAMYWLPVLLVENARVTRGTAAAIESFRNEMVEANNNNTFLFNPMSVLPAAQ
jgi:hypothetical protein